MRLVLRGLWKTPGITLLALATLALGIGASTTIFSAVDAVVLRPLPFPHPEQLLSVRSRSRQFPNYSISWLDYLDWSARQRSFTALAAYAGLGATLTRAGAPTVIAGQKATANYFQVLGVAPELGRTFTAAEDRVGGPDVVVLADSLWRERFGTDRAILGRTIELDARPRTVIGVMPPGFPGFASGEYAPQFFIPLAPMAAVDPSMRDRASHGGLNGLGRLKPGVTAAAARSDMQRIAAGLVHQYPAADAGTTVAIEPFLDRIIRNSAPQTLWMLLAAVGLVLLIACANIANLLLARATSRQKANAVRSALGASRVCLVRDALLESLCLGAGGAALGVGLALVAMRAAPAFIPAYMARADQLYLDGRVLGFAIGVALVTSLLFGMAPAWQVARVEIAAVLKQGGRESAAGSGGRLRGILVATEMALAVVVLVGAGLLVRSMIRLQNVDPGFNPRGVLTFELDLPLQRYPDQATWLRFYARAQRKLASIPGVAAVGFANPLPFNGNDDAAHFTIPGRPAPPHGQEPAADIAIVGGNYLRAMGMRLLRGRAFTAQDNLQSPPAAIIDESFARHYWHGSALGRQIQIVGDKKLTVVGVVARVRGDSLDSPDTRPQLFQPLQQTGWSEMDVALRAQTNDPSQLLAPARAAVRALDPDLPLSDVFTMDQRISQSLQQHALTLYLMGAFAALALLLAAVGLYGVLAYAVAQRTHEIGIRMALGAGAGRVRAQVLGQGLRLAATGAAVGLIAALALGFYARSFLFGVSARDPVTLVAVPAALLAVAALACYLPARRATRVDPINALRGE